MRGVEQMVSLYSANRIRLGPVILDGCNLFIEEGPKGLGVKEVVGQSTLPTPPGNLVRVLKGPNKS